MVEVGKEKCKSYFPVGFSYDGAYKWWINLDEETRLKSTCEEFQKLFSNRWIRDIKNEEDT
jgi:hypothetical protein